VRREGLAVGLFFVAAGALFLLDALEVVSIRAGYLWPLLLIGFGIALIAGGRRRPQPPREPPPPSEETETEAEQTEAEQQTDEEAPRRDEPGAGGA